MAVFVQGYHLEASSRVCCRERKRLTARKPTPLLSWAQAAGRLKNASSRVYYRGRKRHGRLKNRASVVVGARPEKPYSSLVLGSEVLVGLAFEVLDLGCLFALHAL